MRTLPGGWRDRLISIPGCEGAFALDPHDLAATKLLVGRGKDMDLVRYLSKTGRLSRRLVEQRLDMIFKADRLIVTATKALQRAFDEATAL